MIWAPVSSPLTRRPIGLCGNNYDKTHFEDILKILTMQPIILDFIYQYDMIHEIGSCDVANECRRCL